jgi:hypothetical protein
MDRLRDELRAELARFGAQPGLAGIVERWPDAVGDAIARNAWPARIARDGTLHVATTDSVWAFELGHRAPEIAGRLGVPAVRFAPGQVPSGEAPAAAQPPPTASAADLARAAEVAAGIEDPKLRESVQKAVSLGLARAAANRAF